MRYLVLGSAGFIGSAVTKRLLEQGDSVLGVDCFLGELYPASVKRERMAELLIHPNYEFCQRDLRFDSISDLLPGVNVVINEAAIPGLSLSWNRFDLYLECNTRALQNVLESLKSFPDLHFVHASTSSVYGRFADTRFSTETKPHSPYGVSKLAAEHTISSYRENFGISATVLRYFSVFGPNQRPDMAYSRICERLLDDEVIEITGDGTQSRSNTYIDDVVEATLVATDAEFGGLTLDISGGQEISLLDALSELASALDVEPKVVHIPRPPGDQDVTVGQTDRTNSLLGWRATTPVRDGLRLQALAALEQRNK